MTKVTFLLALLLALVFIFRLWSLRPLYTYPFDFSQVQNLYRHSQFAPNPQNRFETISDSDLYAYAGITYLTEGTLDTVNIEHPPLAKYLYGISYLVFGHPAVIQWMIGLFTIASLYVLSLKLLHSPYLSFLPPLLFMMEPLFWEQVVYCELDLPLTLLILILLMVNPISNKNRYSPILSGVALGLLAGVKFPTTAVIIGPVVALFLINEQKKPIIPRLLTFFGLAGLTYLLLYAPLILDNGVFGLIATHIKALRMHLSHVPEYPPLAPLRTMVLNQWPVWFDNENPIRKVTEWSLLWPVYALSIFISPFVLVKRKSHLIKLIVVFTLLYFIFINTRLFFPRYLVPLLPLAAVLLCLLWKEVLDRLKVTSASR